MADRENALKRAMEHEDDWEKLPIGVFYEVNRPAYHEQIAQIKEKTLIEQKNQYNLENLIGEFR